MRFLWRETLTRMTGSETKCPICGADDFGVIERNEVDLLPGIKGIPYCYCFACGAKGDIADIVAAAERKGVEETARNLRSCGELEASNRDLDTYIAGKRTQTDVDAHFARCVEALNLAPHMCGIRAGLSIATRRQLPPDTGTYVAKDAPSAFSLLMTHRYYRVPMTLYRYKFDEKTTCFDAQNPKTLQNEHRIRITGDVGVYLGNFKLGEVPEVVLGTANPRTAGQIYGALRAESSLTPPVIGIAGFPLPSNYISVNVLYLLDAPDSPLPLPFAIRAISTPTVYGTDIEPVIRVLTPHCPASEVTAADVRLLSSKTPHGVPIRQWIVSKLLQNADKCEEVANALLQAGASENTRAELLELLGPNAPHALRETVMLPSVEPDDILTLGTGKLVKNTPIGLYTAFRTAKTCEITTKSILCNVGLRIDARVTGNSGELACCTITHPDTDVPSISVRIPHAHWNNPDALAEDVRSAYAECGRTPYVAFYRVSGYSWADIFQLLGSHCPVQTGIKALGATNTGETNLPCAVIFRGNTRPQTKAGLIDPDALNAYSALDADIAANDADGLTSFLKEPASLIKTGVAAGFLHTLYCTAGKLFEPSGVRRPPAHLIFVETEPGVWDSVIRTLSYIFSGSEYVPCMDYGDRQGFLRHWASLGTLPLITRLPSADDTASILGSSPVSVIGIADPLTALACSGRGTVSFVLPHVESADNGTLSQDTVIALRRAFMAIATEKAGTGWLDIGTGGAISVSTPCISALGAIFGDKDPATVAGGLYRSVRGRYLGVGLTGAKAFFSLLHRSYVDQANGGTPNIALTFVTGAPDSAITTSFNERGEHIFIMPDRVLVSRSIIRNINKEKTFLFDTEQLSREFNENGILLQDDAATLGIDKSRVWVFPRTVWDEEVVRAVGYANRKEQQ